MTNPYDGYSVPAGASLGVNMATAKQYADTHTVAESYLWFANKVRNNKDGHLSPEESWDYKQLGSQYADFGNLNYGTVGLAMGIPEPVLLRLAGLAQIFSNTSRPEFGNSLGGPPYGDDPIDQ